MSTFLSNEKFIYLCGIRIGSSFALWVDFVLIFSVLTFDFSANSQQLGTAAALYGLPPLILGPIFGLWVDRVNAIYFLILSFSIRAVSSILLFWSPTLDIFLFFVLIKGFSNLGAGAAEMVVTRKTLDDEDLLRNTSLVTIFDQAVKIFSPALAGIIAIRSEQSTAFLFSSIGALAGGIFAFLLVSHSSGIERYAAAHRSHGDFAALRALFYRNNIVLVFFLCSAVQTFTLGLYDSQLGILLKELNYTPVLFGGVVSATAAGGVLAGLFFRKIYSSRIAWCSTFSLGLFGSMIIASGCIAIYLKSMVPVLFLCFFFLAGAAYGLTSIGLNVTLQKECPVSSLGLMVAAIRSINLSLLIIAPLIGGGLANFFSIEVLFILAGAFALVFSSVIHVIGKVKVHERLSNKHSNEGAPME